MKSVRIAALVCRQQLGTTSSLCILSLRGIRNAAHSHCATLWRADSNDSARMDGKKVWGSEAQPRDEDAALQRYLRSSWDTHGRAGTNEPSRAEESTEAEQTVKAAVSHTGKSFVKLMQAFLRELSGSR